MWLVINKIDTDLIASNIRNGVDIFWVTGSFAWNNNPLFSNIEFNVSWLIYMEEVWSGSWSAFFESWVTIIWSNLYQVFDFIMMENNWNSSNQWHYTIITKRTPWWVITKFTQKRWTWLFNNSRPSGTTINNSWTTIQIHTSYWPWYFITFDTVWETFDNPLSWSDTSIKTWENINYWTISWISWTFVEWTTSTWWTIWTAMPTTQIFWWDTYWQTNLWYSTGTWWWWTMSINIWFSTKS
jgi:hypothetical protein